MPYHPISSFRKILPAWKFSERPYGEIYKFPVDQLLKSVLTAGKFWYSRNVSYTNKNYIFCLFYSQTLLVFIAGLWTQMIGVFSFYFFNANQTAS